MKPTLLVALLTSLLAVVVLVASVPSSSVSSSSSSSLAARHGSFRYRSYSEMVAFLMELNATYPEVVRVSIAQEMYDLPYPQELMCDGDHPCQQYVVHLTNHSTLHADPSRPEVFFSGALHGNERIGPITTVELIALMAEYATAHANDATASSSQQHHHTRRWIHALVNTRSVYLTPMTNAYGYANDMREELTIDPNRDYNYMRSGRECMQAMTSRVVNELWRDHMFQLAVTFHGGMRAVSYEWGSPNHYLPDDPRRSQKSPDHRAQYAIANTLAAYAGAFHDETFYPTGTMNDIVYGVTGGMEDWGYAASWENQYTSVTTDKPFAPCEPSTFGGYPKAKTVYNNMTHRAFNILVETSNHKEPRQGDLGVFEDLYATELDFQRIASVGHVTRNVRLALMLIELVEPIVRWVYTPPFEPATPSSEFVASQLYGQSTEQLVTKGCGVDAHTSAHVVACNSTRCIIEYNNATSPRPIKLQVGWEVLGALMVDETVVQVATTAAFAQADIISESTIQSGRTRRFYDLTPDKPVTTAVDAAASLFVSCLTLGTTTPNTSTTTLYVRARAMVDQDWTTQGEGVDAPSPRIPPQSHVVNARTNPQWNMTWNGRRVKASLYWYSPVIEVTLIDTSSMNPSSPPSASGSASGSATSEEDDNDDHDDDTTATEPEVITTVPRTTTGTPSSAPTTVVPSSTSSANGEEEEEEEEANDDEQEGKATEPVWPEDDTVGHLTFGPGVTTSPPTRSPTNSTASLRQQTKSTSGGPSLLNYGYLVLGTGGLIIIVAFTYLYKRVLRSKHRSYVNVNQQHARRRRTAQSPSRLEDDEDDDAEEEDEDDV